MERGFSVFRCRVHDAMWPWFWPWLWLMDAPSPLVRTAVPADSGRMMDIHASGFARGWGRADLEQMILSTGHVAEVLVSRGIVGEVVHGFAISRVVAGEAELLTIVIERESRGRGYSGLLLEHHARSVRVAGGDTMFLEVAADNAPALALYRRAGFVEIGRRKGYYPAGGGEPSRDALTMRADLSRLDPTPRYA